MKKILIILMCTALISCEEVLLEKPKSIAVETFYNTPDEIEAALGAIYSAISPDVCMGGRYPAIHNCMVDYAYGRAGHAPLSEFQGLDPTNANRVYIIWERFYIGIRNANLVIKNAPEGENLTEEVISKAVGEAKFMRALIYFTMVRNWGAIPIRTENNMNELDVARSSIEEVYQFIEQDLLYAEEYLPNEASLPGKPTKWAAKTVLADVYFYQAKYSDARNKALEVINSNNYSLVKVEVADDFMKIFGPEVVTTPEEIFYLKYSRESNMGYTYVRFVAHPGTGFHADGGNYIMYSDKVSNPVISTWDKNDLRYLYGWYDWNIGFGANTILSKKFIDPNASAGYNGAGNDYPWYRYTDVLLLYAEADCQVAGSPTADAMEKLNMIHRRAYGKDPLSPSEIDFQLSDYTKSSFLDLVLKERGYETQMESKRWLDLKRLGIVQEVIQATHGKEVAEKMLLWPIPPSELEYNKLITPSDQNPGY